MTELFFALTVGGDPRAKGRPRATKAGGIYTPPRTREAEKALKSRARAAMGGREPTMAPVLLDIAFYCKTARRVDTDNLLKLATDSMNGTVFADDSQIVDIHARKRIDREKPRTVIRVYAVPATQQIIDAA